ncbi:hypothetical protein PR202_gb03515 [Eleusine coracana subsp. coracana]|uniref:Uncharacterized protein n=1 Tax=Eleusine coracana subsp. coracana TaxID=191504 RepID=A0AAV5E1U9_ELECO|nr:hypothetical protein PR202_gb03515 [Eleusine coracana subsp. coracana]
MAEKQGRIAALEVEGSTLKQTLELLHQEIGSTSSKLNDRRNVASFKNKSTVMEPHLQVTTSHWKQNAVEGERHGMFNSEKNVDKLGGDVVNKKGELNFQMESAQLKIEGIKSKRSALLSDINKSKQILEQEKSVIAGFPAALQQMAMKSLEEEYKALQGDKAEEIQYFQSLDETIKGMKSISDLVKCPCGLEYKVELGREAMDIS